MVITMRVRPVEESDRRADFPAPGLTKAGASTATGELRLRLFGIPELSLGGQPVTLRRRSAMALLAYLAVTGRTHRRELLATLLSDGVADDQAGRLLCNAVYELRSAIGDHLRVTPQEV